MFRKTDIVLICVMIAGAAFTYTTKHDAERLLAEVRRLETQIQFERDSIDVLHADWSLLTQPSRLQTLAEIYGEELGLAQVEPTQIGTIGSLPMRPPGIEELIENDGLAAVDGIMTGGVRP